MISDLFSAEGGSAFGGKNNSKGFTLLELLIVIAILAILAAVTIIVLNPAELLRKARDSQRISDLSTIKTSIGYYLINATSPVLGVSGGVNVCDDESSPKIRTDQTSGTITATSGGGGGTSGVAYSGNATDATSSVQTKIDGTGWIPVNLNSLAGGAPIAAWPKDPNPSITGTTDGSWRMYIYGCNKTDLTYEIDANMESVYYNQNGGGDVESTDGGDANWALETGTNLTILPTATGSAYYGGG